MGGLFCARLPDHGITATSLQLVLGLAILAAGVFSEPYFLPVAGKWDQNRLQNGSDAGLVAVYAAALLATIAADCSTKETLNSIWVTCSPLLVLPTVYAGYHLRGACRTRRSEAGRYQRLV